MKRYLEMVVVCFLVQCGIVALCLGVGFVVPLMLYYYAGMIIMAPLFYLLPSMGRWMQQFPLFLDILVFLLPTFFMSLILGRIACAIKAGKDKPPYTRLLS